MGPVIDHAEDLVRSATAAEDPADIEAAKAARVVMTEARR